MKNILMVLAVLSSNSAFAGTELNCKVDEYLNQPATGQTQSYVVSAAIAANNVARIDTTQAKSLNLSFGIETYLSKLVAPGKQYILIGVQDPVALQGTSAGGENSSILFYDTTKGMLSIECHIN